HGLEAEFELKRGYPATVNDVVATEEAEQIIRDQFGDDRWVRIPAPHMGSEDFSLVLEQVPGSYIFLGAGPDHVPAGTTYPHAPDAQFDDAVLGDQAALLAQLAWLHVGRD